MRLRKIKNCDVLCRVHTRYRSQWGLSKWQSVYACRYSLADRLFQPERASQHKDLTIQSSVIRFAAEIGISQGVVVGPFSMIDFGMGSNGIA